MRIDRAGIGADQIVAFNDEQWSGGLSPHPAFRGQALNRTAADESDADGIVAGPSARATRNLDGPDVGAAGDRMNYGGPGTTPDQPTSQDGLSASTMSALGDQYWEGVAPGQETDDAVEDIGTTYSMVVGQSFYGTISNAADEDWIAIELVAGQTYDFRLLGIGAGFLSDPYLALMDSAGNQIAFNDDGFTSSSSTHERDSLLTFTATTTGVYYLAADAFSTETGNYLLSATAQDSAGTVFTADEIAWQLINNGISYFGGPEAAHFNVGEDNVLTVNITALTPEGQYLAREALKAWSAVTNINFMETTDAAEITFDDNESGAFAQPFTSGGVITSSTVNVGLDWLESFGTTLDSYSFETYIHEIGHALGLAHGGNYNGSADYGTDNYYVNDGLAWSIMSYMQAQNDEFDFGSPTDWNTYLDASFRYMFTPMIADIIAIQYLYGVSAEFTGDTVWGFGGTTGVTAIDTAANLGALMAMTVYDTGGVDTLNFSLTSEAQIISLASESMSSVLGGRNNLSIARGVTIENVIGGSGIDIITGNAAANSLDGGAGADVLAGGLGSDIYYVDNIADVAAESINEGTDRVYSSVSFTLGSTSYVEQLFLMGEGNLNGTGNGIANLITGNVGANVLNGKGGADTMVGGLGDDTYFVDNGGDVASELNGQGTDTVFASISYTLGSTSFVESLTLTGSANIDATGNNIANILTGNAGNNVLNGRGGTDTLIGGLGDDSYYVDNLGDIVAELNGQGTDTVFASVSYALGSTSYVESLTLTGSADINGTGNNIANVLTGNAGNNVLNGRGGIDTLIGGLGDDSYYVDLLGDVVTELNGQGTDTVFASVSYGLAGTSYVEALTLTGSADIDANGNGIANVLTGNVGNNVLNGKGGVDALIGGLGDDTYYVDVLGDIVTELDGQGTDTVFASASYALGATSYVESLTLTGSAAINGTGNGIANTIVGNGGNNVLAGRGGADTLTGGAGVDTFKYNAVSDSSFSVYDRITDLTNADRIDLSGIDANTSVAGDQAFSLAASLNAAGRMTLTYNAAKDFTLLSADVNGDGVADIRIVILGDHDDFTNFIF